MATDLTLEQQALLHVIKEKRARQDVDGLAKTLKQFYLQLSKRQDKSLIDAALAALDNALELPPKPVNAPHPVLRPQPPRELSC